MLASLTQGKDCIAITGTSGKTTVTGMVGFLLEQLGDDPTVVNGGIVVNWESADAVGNVRMGTSHRWVIEADESDESLLQYRPDWAIITNVSADHFGIEHARELFQRFAARVTRGLLARDAAAEPWRSFSPELSAGGSSFTYHGQILRVPLLGRHNAENALHAVMLCERLGHRLDRIAEALRRFRGIRRRLDVAGVAGGVTVIDDYAHNPAKIRAAWQAVAPHYKRVLAVWRPHGFGPLSKMHDDIQALFREMGRSCEYLCVLPVYYAGGTPTASVTSEMLVRDLQSEGVPVESVCDYDDLVERITARARPGDVVLSMGARDPNLPALARRILERIGCPSPLSSAPLA
jgi:UDP-N-acetylmuramate--alanine ligase